MTEPKETLAPLSVLVVDDNRINQRLLTTCLEKLGHRVTVASDGREAVTQYRRDAPDLILLDVVMPVMDGLEAARQIRALSSDRWVPIIFLSALDRQEDILEGLEAGGDDYLTKPLNTYILEAKIGSFQRSLSMQKRLIESRERVRIISDSVIDAIITIDASATILNCNAATELIFGWTPEELAGQNVNVLMPEPYHSEHNMYVHQYVMGGPPHVLGTSREVTARRRDGSIFPAEVSVAEMRFDGQRCFIGSIRDISERKRTEQDLRNTTAILRQYYDASEAEKQLVARLMEKQLHRGGLQDEAIRYWLKPAEHFSGDIVGATRAPGGTLYGILADATGHGLGAAVSAIPLLTLFYGLVAREVSLESLVRELNQQLYESMPRGRFVAATILALSPQDERVEIWQGGMPDLWAIATPPGEIRHYSSNHLPLGILPPADFSFAPHHLACGTYSGLLLYSDGLIEARNRNAEAFGEKRLQAALVASQGTRDGLLPGIIGSLQAHLGNEAAQDDISLLYVSLNRGALAPAARHFAPINDQP